MQRLVSYFRAVELPARFRPALRARADVPNNRVLAALDDFCATFVPVDIEPTVGRVESQVGKELLRASVWSGMLICVESLRITAHTSGGKILTSPVCMAISPDLDDIWMNHHVLVTPDAQQLSDDYIWHHLGGWVEDGDTYDTQRYDFERELELFWLKLVGPDEQLRRSIFAATGAIKPAWTSVEILPDGTVRVLFKNRKVKSWAPPAV